MTVSSSCRDGEFFVPVFEYIALTNHGRQERGRVDADSASDARRKLRAARVHVVKFETEPAAPVLGRRLSLRRIRPRDVAVATRQLAMLLHSGTPLVPALGALVEQQAGHPLGRVLAQVRDRVNEGRPLARALEEHPRVFPELFVSLVGAGEASGALEEVLLRLADMSERRVNLMNKVRAALAYPLFMSAVAVGVVTFLLSYVVPSITRLFTEMHRALPWPTQALMAVSRFVQEDFPAVLIALLLLVLLGRMAVGTAAGRAAWDRWKLRMPLVGDLALKMAIGRFARTLGTLLASGVPILDALEIVKRVGGNRALEQALDNVKESVRHGDSLAQPLRRSGFFPPIVCHLIASGERGGTVEDGLVKVADIYDNEVETTVATLMSLLEPVLILALGAVVGFIVLSILLPIFDINQAIH